MWKKGLALLAIPLLGAASAVLGGCWEGVRAGSVQDVFAGIGDVVAKSPTTARITWKTNYRYQSYQVYGNYSSEPLTERIFDNAEISGLTPTWSYTFTVVAINGNERSGFERERQITMPARFAGVKEVIPDENNDPVVIWDYPHNAEFHVFYRKWEDPSSGYTGGWALDPSWSVVSKGQQVVFRGLEGSTRYHFAVHAKYGDETYERPAAVLTGTTDSTFRRPTIILPEMVIGSLPFVKVVLDADPMYPAENFRSQAFWRDPATGNNVPVSDPLVRGGIMMFTPTANLGRGLISGISVEVNYNDGVSINETFVDDGRVTYIKGQSEQLDMPPEQNLGSGEAYLGKAVAAGDFDCDGLEDLAIGMPNGSVGSLGVKNANAGAVYVYYSKGKATAAPSLADNLTGTPMFEPANPGEDPQIITFDDLPANSYFGFSLASGGNLNGDQIAGNPCEELIVGAYGLQTPGTAAGASGTAFVFFGSGTGLSSPAHLSDFPSNIGTCREEKDSSICSAVRLAPDHSIWPENSLGGQPYTPTWAGAGYGWDYFGYTVSFVGDFNADGYDDIAVGAPYGDWDGSTTGSYPVTSQAVLSNVGYVAMFFGSPNGLGYEKPFASAPYSADGSDRFRWLKIYPPQPQPGMNFGMAIHGGADVDGKYRVVSGDGTTTHGGSDMIIGAPGFQYYRPNHFNVDMPTGGGPATNKSVPFADFGWSIPFNPADPTNFFGIPQNGGVTGVAYLYFGRAWENDTIVPSMTTDRDKPYRGDFWNCGKRGMDQPYIHMSCLADSQNVRVIFPRRGDSTGFGNAVALVGARSHWMPDNSSYTPGVDPLSLDPYVDGNADGFAEAIVAASTGDGANSNSGVLWEYFGNRQRIYEAGDSGSGFGSINIGGVLTAEGEYRDGAVNDVNCLTFNDPVGNPSQLENCAPTLLQSESLASGGALGHIQEAIAVGDVTGDGYIDLVIGAPSDNTYGSLSGAAYLLAAQPGRGVMNSFIKIATRTSDASDRVGWAVDVGNFDKDFGPLPNARPYGDIVLGAPYSDGDRPAGGEAHLFLSGGSPINAIQDESQRSIVDGLATPQEYGYHNARIVGDINNDGYDDAVARMKRYDTSGSEVYDAVLYFGSEEGLITSTYCANNLGAVLQTDPANFPEDPGNPGHPYTPSSADCYPSANHVVGAAQDGFLLPQLVVKPNNMDNLWAYYNFGVGDVNKDSFDDVLFWNGNSSILVYYGSATGLQAISNPSWIPATSDPQIVSQVLRPSFTNYYYSSVSNQLAYVNFPFTHGDFNGDGYSDIVIADPAASHPGPTDNLTDPADAGASVAWDCAITGAVPSTVEDQCNNGSAVVRHGIVYVLYGSGEGVQTPSVRDGTFNELTMTDPVEMLSAYGTEAAGEIPCSTPPTPPGATSPPAKICRSTFIRNPVFENIDFGFARLADHHFGATVTAIDHDNDGFDDLFIGSPGYEDLGCHDQGYAFLTPVMRDFGRIFVYRGGPTGITAAPRRKYFPFTNATLFSAAPNSTAHAEDVNAGPSLSCGDPNGLDPSLGVFNAEDDDAYFNSLTPPMTTPNGNVVRALQWGVPDAPKNQVGSQFGFRVSVAGDVNGDGYEDLLVATPTEAIGWNSGSMTAVDPGIGRFRIYYGPICGFDNELDVRMAAEGNMNTQLALLNPLISGVDKQGCSRPNATGPETGPKPPVQLAYVRDGLSGENWGHTIVGGRKGKSDVNGDGYDDLLIATHIWDNPATNQTDIGRGVVFFGDQSGLYAVDYPNPTVLEKDGKFNPFSLVPAWEGAELRFFELNLSAGDVNNDGTVDYMVPSRVHDGVAPIRGVDLGAFFVFY